MFRQALPLVAQVGRGGGLLFPRVSRLYQRGRSHLRSSSAYRRRSPQLCELAPGPWNARDGEVLWGQNVGGQNLGGTFFGPVGTYNVVTDPQCAPGGILDTTDAMNFNIRTGVTCPLRAIANSSGQILLQNPMPGKRGTLGQQTITGPETWRLDGSMSKTFRLTESKQIQLRFDATNILNHPDPFVATGNNSTPEYSINDTDFGTIAEKGNQNRTFQGQLRFQF